MLTPSCKPVRKARPFRLSSLVLNRSVLTALLLAAAPLCAQTKRLASPTIGLELYSLRDEMKKDVPATLAKVKKMGFKEVEVPGYYGLTAEQFKQELDKAQLVAHAALFPYERLRDDLPNVIREAKVLKVRYVGCAWIPHQEAFDAQELAQAVTDFKKSAAQLKKAGLQLFYHIHGYEFQPSGQGTLFDELVQQTKGALVFELDVFWAFHGGQDPAAMLRKYPGKFPLMHLKDMKKGTPVNDLTGHAPDETSVALGSGQLDFPAIIHAAAETGVRYYYIEDEAPAAAEQIPQSLTYLSTVK